MKKKILTITVSKQWFDMIVAGECSISINMIRMYYSQT